MSNPSPHVQDDTPPGLSLEEWLKAQNLSYSAFARLVPCSTSYPRMVAQGIARPSYEMAQRIEELTDGMVSREWWYPPSKKGDSQQTNDLDELFEG